MLGRACRLARPGGGLSALCGLLRRAGSGPATVAEHTISCTFILQKQNKRVTVPGMVGWSLLETAQHHRLPLEGERADAPWDYNTLGEGPGSVTDHVVLDPQSYEKVGPPGDQEYELLESGDGENMTPTSRLAACIMLTKEMDGLTAMVPETNATMKGYC